MRASKSEAMPFFMRAIANVRHTFTQKRKIKGPKERAFSLFAALTEQDIVILN